MRRAPYGADPGRSSLAIGRRHRPNWRGRLRHSAGNFYINDKPTGAVVGQQPFGGSRRLRHQRQGRLLPQPHPLDLTAHHQGELRAAEALCLPVHGRRVNAELGMRN